jgi:hypothetical protein
MVTLWLVSYAHIHLNSPHQTLEPSYKTSRTISTQSIHSNMDCTPLLEITISAPVPDISACSTLDPYDGRTQFSESTPTRTGDDDENDSELSEVTDVSALDPDNIRLPVHGVMDSLAMPFFELSERFHAQAEAQATPFAFLREQDQNEKNAFVEGMQKTQRIFQWADRVE